MIITLRMADFSQSNIGTLSTWRISRSIGAGATYEGPTSVDKGAAFNATITIAEGYELGTAGVTVTMGGAVLSGAHTISGNVITITIAEVTGNVLIKVPTINTAGGDDPVTPDTPDEPTETPITAIWTLDSAWYAPAGQTVATPFDIEGRARTSGEPLSLSKAVAADGVLMTFNECASDGTVTSTRIMNKFGTFTGFDASKKYQITMYKAEPPEYDEAPTTQNGNVTQAEIDNGSLIQLYTQL
jgi:hypothetical protein